MTKQFKRAFMKTKSHVSVCQMYVKRYLAMRWFHDLRNKKKQLDKNLEQINSLINHHNSEASLFKGAIKDYGSAYEGYLVDKVQKRIKGEPGMSKVTDDLKRLLEENRALQHELKAKELNEYEDEETKGLSQQLTKELGSKAGEYHGMIKNVKNNIKRVSEEVRKSKKLPIKIQHVYSYSKWDSINEPFDVVENILKNDDNTYKSLSPDIDLTLNNCKR